MTSGEPPEAAVEPAPDRLEVSVGNAALEPGRTHVVLDSTGAVSARTELEGSDPRRADAKLDPERATRMIATAGESAMRAREGKRYGLPDEPRYHFEVGDGPRRQTFDVWRSELPDHPELARIVAALQEIVDEQARGEIIL
jgi:hypothetical protein